MRYQASRTPILGEVVEVVVIGGCTMLLVFRAGPVLPTVRGGAPAYAAEPVPANEGEMLKNEAAMLKEQLTQIEARLEELEEE